MPLLKSAESLFWVIQIGIMATMTSVHRFCSMNQILIK